MSSTWFVRQAGKVYGPFDSARLRKLGTAGKIAKDSGVSKDRLGPWTEASRVRGLFPEIPAGDEASSGESVEDQEEPVSEKRWSWFGGRSSCPKPAVTSDSAKPMWYVRDEDDDPTGPITAGEMAKLVDGGRVRPATFVLRH